MRRFASGYPGQDFGRSCGECERSDCILKVRTWRNGIFFFRIILFWLILNPNQFMPKLRSLSGKEVVRIFLDRLWGIFQKRSLDLIFMVCLCFSSLTSIPNILSILFMISFAVIVAVSGSGNDGGLTRNLSVLFKGGHEIFVPPPAGSKAKVEGPLMRR